MNAWPNPTQSPDGWMSCHPPSLFPPRASTQHCTHTCTNPIPDWYPPRAWTGIRPTAVHHLFQFSEPFQNKTACGAEHHHQIMLHVLSTEHTCTYTDRHVAHTCCLHVLHACTQTHHFLITCVLKSWQQLSTFFTKMQCSCAISA